MYVSDRPRVLLADDHPLVRLALREELEEAGFDVCVEAGDAAGAVEGAARERPDVCLLDVTMPGDGLVAAEEIVAGVPDARVVMITATPCEETMLAALDAGAVGYLAKDLRPERLAPILHDVLLGGTAFPRRLTTRLVAWYRTAKTL